MKRIVDAAAYFDRLALALAHEAAKGGDAVGRCGTASGSRADACDSVAAYLQALPWHLLRHALPAEREGRVLELGGGSGRWAVPLARLGYHVTLVDISAGRLAAAAERLAHLGLEPLVELRRADMTDLAELPRAAYPLVLASGSSLNYCAAPRRAVQQMRRVCAREGHVFLEPASRAARLRALLAAREAEAACALVEDGGYYESYRAWRVRRHEFEIRELLGMLWDEGLTVVSVLGNSALLAAAGRRALARLLAEAEPGQALALEETLSQDEHFLSLADRFEVLCQVL